MGIERHDIGGDLMLARRRAGLTQQQVADRIGVSRMTVSRIESGAAGAVAYQTIADFAALVGLTLTTT